MEELEERLTQDGPFANGAVEPRCVKCVADDLHRDDLVEMSFDRRDQFCRLQDPKQIRIKGATYSYLLTKKHNMPQHPTP